jgi:hypothetical protein
MEFQMNRNVLVQSIMLVSQEAEEALLTITDGVHTFTAFSQPCSKSPGDIIEEVLYAFDTKKLILKGDEGKPYIKQKNGDLQHEILGVMLDVENKILQVGDILIEIDTDLPGGLQTGDYVEFTCERLDLF